MAEVVVTPLLTSLTDRWDSIAEAFGDEQFMGKTRLSLSKLLSLACMAEKQSAYSEVSRSWLSMLKDVAYDVDDVLDDCERLLTVKFKSSVLELLRFRKNIKSINDRLDKCLYLGASSCSESQSLASGTRNTSTGMCDKSQLIGRDTDVINIVELLMGNPQEPFFVMPIVGMVGIGKTTLAKLVYCHETVRARFELIFWIWVGQDFDVDRIIKEVVTYSKFNLRGDGVESRNTVDVLWGKRFLIVLDDVWVVDDEKWYELRRLLSVGATGSGIIITSTIVSAAHCVATCPPYRLTCFSEDDSRTLFSFHAFKRAGERDIRSEQIVMGCGGLPIALKTLGSLIGEKREVNELWRYNAPHILESPQFQNIMMPLLRQSYDFLPPHLKQCFAYCSIFPKGYWIPKQNLILLWIAEGFVHSTGGSETLEGIADDYFMELVKHSLFYKSARDDNGNVFEIQMHNMVHDLAKYVSQECLIVENKEIKNASRVTHCSLICESGSSIMPSGLRKANKMRTFLLLSGKLEKVPHFLQKFNSLRVLGLSQSGIRDLPDFVGNLVHLRYLDVSCNYIRTVPDSIIYLKHLQVLELSKCYNLQKLPKAVCELKHIIHLGNTCCCSLTYMPSGIGKLRFLKVLPLFVLGNKYGCAGLEEIGEMDLMGRLEISNLEYVTSAEEAKKARLHSKTRVRSLELRWGFNKSNRANIDAEVLSSLCPPRNLELLALKGYRGSLFPAWMSRGLLNLNEVSLVHCSCQELPPLGRLPFLKNLYIKGIHAVKTIGHEFYGNESVRNFPSLQQMSIYDMPNLTEWKNYIKEEALIPVGEASFSREAFPCLDTLIVQGCSILNGLPFIPNLRNLAVSEFKEMLLRSLTHMTSLSSLLIKELRRPYSMPNDLSSIQRLTVYDCDCVESLFEGITGFSSIKYLTIAYCSKLICLPFDIGHLTTLQKLEIAECELLVIIPNTVQHLSSLEELVIAGCPTLESLPDAICNLTNLEKLMIRSCPLLVGQLDKKVAHIPIIDIQ